MIQTIFSKGSELLNTLDFSGFSTSLIIISQECIKNALVSYLSIKHDLHCPLMTHQASLLLMIRIPARIVISSLLVC